MSFVPSFPPQIPVGMIAPHSTAGTHPSDAPQPLQQGGAGIAAEKASAAPSSISETVTGERRSSLIDQVLGQGGATGQRRGSILDSLQAGAENLLNKAAKFIDDSSAPSTTQTTHTTTSPSGVTTTTTTTTTVVKTTSTNPNAAVPAVSNGQSITDKISSTLSNLQANVSNATTNTTSPSTTSGNTIGDKLNELKINAQTTYNNREVLADAVDRNITEREENFSPRSSEVGKKVESNARNLEVKATGFLDQVTAAVQQVGEAIERRTSVSGGPGLLTRVEQGAEALRRSADGILDSGTLGAGAAGGLADPIKRLSVSQPTAPAVASTSILPPAETSSTHIAPTAPGPPVLNNAVASGSGLGAGGIVPSHPEVVEGGSGEKPIVTTTNEVPHSTVV